MGTNTWYVAKPDVFVAVCHDPRHGKGCRKHRTRRSGREQRKGRLVGYMAAWLQATCDLATSGSLTTAKEHMAFTPSLALRKQARRDFAATGPFAQALSRKERPKREDEGSEPELCP